MLNLKTTVSVQDSFSVLKGNLAYEVLQSALILSRYTIRIRRESPSENIIGIEVDCSPILMADKIELFNEVFGYKYNISKNTEGSYLLFTLKKPYEKNTVIR